MRTKKVEGGRELGYKGVTAWTNEWKREGERGKERVKEEKII